MTTADRAVHKYLKGHAEPEAKWVAGLTKRRFANVLTIPAHAEGSEVLRVLRSIPAPVAGDVLTILVVNARADCAAPVHAANEASCAALRAHYGAGRAIAPNATLFEHERGALLLLQRAGEGHFLPPRQGVGLARKIGADLALAAVAHGIVNSRFIHCTDADALLPADYFERADQATDATAALVHPFRHVHWDDTRSTDPPQHGAASREALEYEIWLRYYVLGLHYAGSPYAYQSIGSTLAPAAAAYARARGFPKRMAGEDFHLLAKLRKLGRVESLPGPPILLSDRPSERVPFGTGAAIRSAAPELAQGRERRCLPASIFEGLRTWLSALDRAARGSTDLEVALAEAPSSVDRAVLLAALDEGGHFERAQRALRDEARPEQRLRRLHDAFDALATLKLLHALRDRGHPSLPLRTAVSSAPFVAPSLGDAPLERMRDELEGAELQRIAALR